MKRRYLRGCSEPLLLPKLPTKGALVWRRIRAQIGGRWRLDFRTDHRPAERSDFFDLVSTTKVEDTIDWDSPRW